MDEKEKEELQQRCRNAFPFESKIDWPVYFEGFRSGALAQDSISRRAEREKIKQNLIERIYKLEYKDNCYSREEILDLIKLALT